MASLVNSPKRRADIIFYKGLQKIKGEWTLLNSFYDKNIKIRQKVQKKKLQTSISCEYRHKNLQQNTTKPKPETYEKIIYHSQVEFIEIMQSI